MSAEKHSNFVLGKKNFYIIAVGFLTIIFGFILMSGGASEDPNVFSKEIFNTRRLTIAPIVCLLGFLIVGLGIMLKPTATLDEELSN